MKTLPPGFTVYCDESRHDGSVRNLFMTIGGLWVPTEQKTVLTRELRALLAELGLRAEVKWSKVSAAKLDAYKRLVDFFVAKNLRFRVIVVEQAKLDYDRFKQGDEELGFYTFYFEMLVKWLTQPVTYNILLDLKKNKGADHYEVLTRCLRARVPDNTTVSGVHVIDSSESPLAQLNDILTGAVAASWCGFPGATPKAQLADYIAASVGRRTLSLANVSPAFDKFNVFKIDLK